MRVRAPTNNQRKLFELLQIIPKRPLYVQRYSLGSFLVSDVRDSLDDFRNVWVITDQTLLPDFIFNRNYHIIGQNK